MNDPRNIVRVLNYRAKQPADGIVVNTTSKSTDFSGLSPFYLGPVDLYGEMTSAVFENAWQYAKVYDIHAEPKTNNDPMPGPTPAYWNWARDGWSKAAVRYPMGRGAKPLYSLWDGDKLGYIEARKQIYAPLYECCVEPTEAYERLSDLYQRCCDTGTPLYLKDFDGYASADYRAVINNPAKKMGHAFVLAMMLTGQKHYW